MAFTEGRLLGRGRGLRSDERHSLRRVATCGDREEDGGRGAALSRSSRLCSMARIAKGLRAERMGKARAGGGYFSALQLVAEIEAGFRVPAGALPKDRREVMHVVRPRS